MIYFFENWIQDYKDIFSYAYLKFMKINVDKYFYKWLKFNLCQNSFISLIILILQ